MAILAKMDYEVSPKPPSAELLVRTRLQQIKTRGDLKAYAIEVAQKIALKRLRGNRKC